MSFCAKNLHAILVLSL